MESSSKRRKVVITETDKISGLPDALIGEILSFLPAREAVATSILSKRWRYSWTSMKNLDFVFCPWKVDLSCRRTFVEFVDKVLMGTSHQLHVNRWVTAATNRNVELMTLNIPWLPTSVFTCNSITTLKVEIYKHDVATIPDSICLPNLKYLTIRGDLVGSIAQLVSGCPALTELIMFVTIGSTQNFVISANCLDYLEMHTSTRSYKTTTIVLDTPELLCLKIEAKKSLPDYVLKNLGKLYRAWLSLEDEVTSVTSRVAHSVIKHLKNVNNVKGLTLGSEAMLALYFNYHLILDISSFNNLEVLDLRLEEVGSYVIFDLLQASLILKRLVLTMEKDEFHWIPKDDVPSCVSSTLVGIDLKNCRGSEGELEMIKYFLRSAEVLQKFYIDFQLLKRCDSGVQCYRLQNEETRKKVSQFPRASKSCEVRFRQDDEALMILLKDS